MLNEDTYCLLKLIPPFQNPVIHLIIENIISFETAFLKIKNQ